MKKVFTILAAVFLTFTLWAQSPEKMNYQAVIRNSSDALITSTQIGMQISILQGSPDGTAVYVETQTPTSNANGLVSIEIGTGTVVSGEFATINWANGPFFIKTEVDLTQAGGTNYTISGVSQLISVPYALHAKTAETITGEITESDPVFTAWDKNFNDLINAPTIPNVPTNVSAFTNDAGYLDSFTESQILTISNDTIYLTGGSFVKLPIGNYNNLINKPLLWDSTYSSIKNIPDLAGYATKDMANQNITNLANPVSSQDATTKAYVDALLTKITALENRELANLTVHGFTDPRDGNNYKVVKIGNQVWLAENLRYLPSVIGNGTGSETTPYYYVYNYDGSVVAEAKATLNYTTYGVLYNWPAAMAGSESSTANPSGVQGVCPTGWHLPSDDELTQLTEYLGGTGVAGGKLKETGTTHWYSPNSEATNETGFTALPGGRRDGSGEFQYVGDLGSWWSTTEYNTSNAWYWSMYNDHGDVAKVVHTKTRGLSVRCIGD